MPLKCLRHSFKSFTTSVLIGILGTLPFLAGGCRLAATLRGPGPSGLGPQPKVTATAIPVLEVPEPSELDRLFETAEALYELGRYEDARQAYQKVLFRFPDHELALRRIEEIHKWLPLLQQTRRQFQKAVETVKEENRQVVEDVLAAKELILEDLEKTREQEEAFRQRALVARALLEASMALADHDFETARQLTKKAMIGRPDSRKPRELWDKINRLEEEWREVQILKEHAKLRERTGAAEAKSAALKKEQDVEQRIQAVEREARLEIEDILSRRFVLEQVPPHLVTQFRASYLEEQALSIYRKAIRDYDRDMESGFVATMPETDRKDYESAVAEAYLRLGEYAAHFEQMEDAVRYFEEFLKRFPEAPQIETVHYALGDVLIRLGKMDEAYFHYEKIVDALKAGEQYTPAMLRMAEIHRRQANFQAAMNFYQNLLDFWRSDPVWIDRIEHHIADTLHEQGDLPAAFDAYSRLVQKGVRSNLLGTAKLKRAQTLMEMGRYAEARILFENMLREDPLDPLRPEAAYSIGETFFREGQYPRSVIEYEKAFELFPETANPDRHLFYLGRAYRQLAVLSSAEVTWQRLLDRHGASPFAAEARYHLAGIFYQTSRYQEARDQLLNLIRDFPQSPSSASGKYLLGDVYFAAGQFEAADRQYRVAYTDHPEGLEAAMSLYKRAKSLKAMARTELLEKYFQDVIQHYEQDRAPWKLLKAQHPRETEEYFSKILFEYGNFLKEQGKLDQAVVTLERLVEDFPQSEERFPSQYLMGKVFEDTDQKEKAKKQYQSIVASGAQNFWVDQARFNLESLVWKEKYQHRALELGGHLAESIGSGAA